MKAIIGAILALTLSVEKLAMAQQHVTFSNSAPVNNSNFTATVATKANVQTSTPTAPITAGETISLTVPTKANGGTKSRSLSERFGDIINVKDYGAVCDGATDDSVSIQAALTQVGLRTHGAVVSLPGGQCYMGTGVIAVVRNSQGLVIHSQGQNGTRLLFPSSFVGTGLSISFNSLLGVQNKNYPSFALDGVTLESQRTSGVGGTGLYLTMAGSGGIVPSLHLGDIVITSTGNGAWQTGIYLDAMNVTNVDHVTCSGMITGETCMRYDTAGPISVEHHIESFYALGKGGIGLLLGSAAMTGPLQGFTINTLSCTGLDGCVNAQGTNTDVIDQLLINSGQVNTKGIGISTTFVNSVGLHNIYFLNNGTAFYDKSGARLTVTGNTFYDGPPNVSGLVNRAIVLDHLNGGPASGAAITGNVFTNLYGAQSSQATVAARPIQIINGTNYVSVMGNLCLGQSCVNDTAGNVSNSVGPNVESVSGVGTMDVFDTTPFFKTGVKLGLGSAPAILSGDGVGNAIISPGGSISSANLMVSNGAIATPTLFLSKMLNGPHWTAVDTTMTTLSPISAPSYLQNSFIVPTSSKSACTRGQFGDGVLNSTWYHFYCYAPNSWVRSTMTRW